MACPSDIGPVAGTGAIIVDGVPETGTGIPVISDFSWSKGRPRLLETCTAATNWPQFLNPCAASVTVMPAGSIGSSRASSLAFFTEVVVGVVGVTTVVDVVVATVVVGVLAAFFAAWLSVFAAPLTLDVGLAVGAFAVPFPALVFEPPVFAFGALDPAAVFFAWPFPLPCANAGGVVTVNANNNAARIAVNLMIPPWSTEWSASPTSNDVPPASQIFSNLPTMAIARLEKITWQMCRSVSSITDATLRS
jgi:hypothetical protein